MNASCARCRKTVYPVEKLNCLDKTWHKGCLKCEVCDLKLTMKTYKGYNKLPYCGTHYPTTKFTAISDTPENRRLAIQAQHQSELVYNPGAKSAEYTEEESNNMEFLRHKMTLEQRSAVKTSKPASRPIPTMEAPPPPASPGSRYVAVYDYVAADDDEISFHEGDHIDDVTVIDDGWGEGRVERTGESGMFPINYAEAV